MVFLLFLTFMDSQVEYVMIRNKKLSYILRTKIHFLLLGIVLHRFVFESHLYDYFTDINYVIISFIGFLIGFQLRAEFLRKLPIKDLLQIVLRSAILILFFFISGFILTKNIYVSGLLAIITSTLSYYYLFVKGAGKMRIYIFSVLTAFLFIFALENYNETLINILLKVLLIISLSYFFILAVSQRKLVEIYILLIGFLLILSGISRKLDISNLTFSFFMGFIITNIRFESKKKLENTLLNLETPMFSLMLFVLGLLVYLPHLKYFLIMTVFWIMGIFGRTLMFKEVKLHLPLTQVAILFLFDFHGRFNQPFVSSFALLYILSNVSIFFLRKDDKKIF